MKLYLFFIHHDKADEIREWHIESKVFEVVRGEEYELFAYTKHEDEAKMFMQIYDMRYFTLATPKVTEDEYIKFKNSHSGTKLTMLKSGINGKLVKLPMSDDQSQSIEEYYYGEVFTNACEHAKYPYEIFKDEYIKSLDALFYTYYHLMMRDEADTAENNESYNMTALGFFSDVKHQSNQLSIFIQIYGHILLQRKETN